MSVAPGPAGRVLVVGEALVDVRTDERAGARTTRGEHPGGSPLTVAVGLARLGLATTLAAQVGDDVRGEAVSRHLAHSGVELLRLPPVRRTSTATARIRPGGFATYDFDLTWDPATLPDPRDFALVHVGSIGATLAPGADAVADLVTAAGQVDVPVSFDPNVRPTITPDLDDVRRRVRDLARASTLVKLSDEDAGLLHPRAGVDRVAADLAALPGVRLAVVTRGRAGLVLRSSAHHVAVPPASDDVVDTIGAGDTVTAALLAGLLSARLLDPGADRLGPGALGWLGRLAATAAAVCCSRPGADPPWLAELPGLLATGPSTDT